VAKAAPGHLGAGWPCKESPGRWPAPRWDKFLIRPLQIN
jgi:hypothetical protein